MKVCIERMESPSKSWDNQSFNESLSLAWKIRNTDQEKASKIVSDILGYLETLPEADNAASELLKACVQVVQSSMMRRNDEFRQALLLSLDACATLKDMGVQLWLGRAYNNLGVIYLHFGARQDGIQCLIKQLEIGQALNDAELTSAAYHNLGMAYMGVEDYQTAAGYFESVLPEIKIHDDIIIYTYAVTNLVDCWIHLGYYAESWKALNNCLSLAKEAEQHHAESVALRMVGTLEEALSNNKKALSYYYRSKQLNDIYGNKYTGILLCMAIGRVHLNSSNPEVAQQHFLEALHDSLETENSVFQYQIHELLSKAYTLKDDATKALHHFKEYHELKESILNHQSEQQIATLKLIYDNKIADKRSQVPVTQGKISIPPGGEEGAAEYLAQTQVKELMCAYSEVRALNEKIVARISSVVHDVRSRMMVITVYNDILESRSNNLSTEKRSNAHNSIRRSVEQITRLLSTTMVEINDSISGDS